MEWTVAQKNEAIAKYRGWVFVDTDPDYEPYWSTPAGHTLAKTLGDRAIPDYCNDLNRMHKLEQEIQGAELWGRYVRNLWDAGPHSRLPQDDWQLIARCIVSATAQERATAFIKTLKLL